MEYDALEKRLRERAEKIRGDIKSCERIVELLAPEMVKFEARSGHDTYTARMSVDHSSSIRSHIKEVNALEGAADAIADLRARNEALCDIIFRYVDPCDVLPEDDAIVAEAVLAANREE